MCGHHSIIYPIPINIFNTLNAEYETEWSTFLVFVQCLKTSFTLGLNTATFIGKQLHISVVYDHHQATIQYFKRR